MFERAFKNIGDASRKEAGCTMELDREKPTPLLKLKYLAIPNATRVPGNPEQIRKAFVGFQRYLYEKGEWM